MQYFRTAAEASINTFDGVLQPSSELPNLDRSVTPPSLFAVLVTVEIESACILRAISVEERAFLVKKGQRKIRGDHHLPLIN
jgi:hypothetical protein